MYFSWPLFSPLFARFCKHTDENKRQKVILDKLITMTIDEVEMYPSIQAKIWGNIGQVSDLLDMVLDSFIKVSKRKRRRRLFTGSSHNTVM